MSRPARTLPELLLALLGFTALFTAFFADTMFDRVLGFGDGPGYFQPFFERPRALWTDSLFAGYPVSGDAQSGFFNPLAIVMKHLGLGFDAFVVSGFVLCGAGGFAFGKALTGSRLAGALAGVVVSLSAFVVGQFDHTAVVHTVGWVVCALAAAERCAEAGSWRSFMALACSIAMMVLAGSFQFTTYGAALVAARLVLSVVTHPSRGRLTAQLLFALCSAGLLSLLALSPAFELVGMSMRASLTWENFVSNTYHPGLLPSFVFPELFIGRKALEGLPDVEASGFVGVVVLLLAGVGAVAGPRRSVRFWCIVVVVSLALSLGPSTPLAGLAFRVPGWNLFRGPSRHLFECTVGLAALAAHGVGGLQASQLTSRQVGRLGLGVVAVLSVAIALLFWSTPRAVSIAPRWSLADARIGLPLVLVVVALALIRARVSWSAAALVGVAAAELGFVHRLAHWRGSTPLEQQAGASAAIDRLRAERHADERIVVLRGYWDPDVPANSALAHGLPSASGYSPLEPAAFADATSIDPNGVVTDVDRLLGEGSSLLDVLAVGLVVAPADLAATERFEKVASLPNGVLHRNLRARPRAWFVTETMDLDFDETRTALFDGALPDGRRFDPDRTAIVRRFGAHRFQEGCEAEVTRRDEGVLDVATRCEGDGFLVVSERGFPGWQGSIDGRPAVLWRADLLVTGLEVPSGSHLIELRYAPTSVVVGAAAAMMGLALLVLGLVKRRQWFAGTQAG